MRPAMTPDPALTKGSKIVFFNFYVPFYISALTFFLCTERRDNFETRIQLYESELSGTVIMYWRVGADRL